MTLSIKFNAKILATVAIAQSTDGHRPQICGVFFEGTRVVATDGHIFLAGNDVDCQITGAGTLPISKKLITALRKPKAVVFTYKDGISRVVTANRTILAMEPSTPIDAPFPNAYQRVVPSARCEPTIAACFAEDTLTQLALAAKTLGGKGAGFRMSGASATSPYIVEFAATSEVFGVIMPWVEKAWREEDNQVAQLPAWWEEES